MRLLLRTLLTLIAAAAILLAWGLSEPYLLDVEFEPAPVAGLPPAWEGQRFAQISDLQVGMWADNSPTVRRAARRLLALRPAFVVISGDFVYHAAEEPEEALNEVLAQLGPLLASDIPVLAVLGNHDYAMPHPYVLPDRRLARRVAARLAAAGVRVLHNEAVALTTAGARPLYVVGIGAHWPEEDDTAAALVEVPANAARVVVMHNPGSFPALPAGTAPLAVAGHTHGGQIRLPFTPEWSWLTFTQADQVHADGWITDYGAPGNRLYVNRGIGFSLIPLRINAVPEVTVFTLRRRP